MTELKERDERGGYIVPLEPLTWWKFMFDVRTQVWDAYGRAVFVQARSMAAAATAAREAAQKDYPGAEIRDVGLGASTPEAAAAFAARRARINEWQANVKAGIPNTRATLEPSAPETTDHD